MKSLMREYTRQHTDEAFWEAFIQGEESAFEELYKRFYPLLYSYGYRMTGDKMLVSDIIQNLFMKLFQDSARLLPINNVRAYLFGAFRNRLLNALQAERPMEDIRQYEEFFLREEPATLFSLFPEEDKDLLRKQNLQKALSALKPNQREILYLFYVKNLSHNEIATILSINYQSSKNLLSRSLAKLRDIYFSL